MSAIVVMVSAVRMLVPAMMRVIAVRVVGMLMRHEVVC